MAYMRVLQIPIELAQSNPDFKKECTDIDNLLQKFIALGEIQNTNFLKSITRKKILYETDDLIGETYGSFFMLAGVLTESVIAVFIRRGATATASLARRHSLHGWYVGTYQWVELFVRHTWQPRG